MQPVTDRFNDNVEKSRENPSAQKAILRATAYLSTRRTQALERLPEFEALRDQAAQIRDHVLANLDHYLEKFEAKVLESGGHVHWCSTADRARETVLQICRRADAKSVTKGKSMIVEELGLNDFLEQNGIEPVETDVGEHIIQIAHEPPSHIVGPAIHKNAKDVSDLFYDQHRKYGKTERLEQPEQMVARVREILREKYFQAEVGITGANFLIAETGSTVIVTNEGNGDLTQMFPRAHIVVASIEKVVPTLDDAGTLLRVLGRSATGQEMTSYTTFSTGPRRPEDADGPEQFHVVLYDGNRSDMLGTESEAALRCIRCGACLNHCPVYQVIGGQAYGWVYPGPIGAALTPALLGIEQSYHLPNASSFCGRCEEVCPVRIPLPAIMHHWRVRAFEEKVPPASERFGLQVWAYFAKHPALYRAAARLTMGVLGALGRRKGHFSKLPLAVGWTEVREFPAPQGKTFMDAWSKRPS